MEKMSKESVNLYLAQNAKYFPVETVEQVKGALAALPEEAFSVVAAMPLKSPDTMLLTSLFAGTFGIDRFLIGDMGQGVGKLLTAGGCGIWTIIDWFSIQNATKAKNYELFCQVVGQYGYPAAGYGASNYPQQPQGYGTGNAAQGTQMEYNPYTGAYETPNGGQQTQPVPPAPENTSQTDFFANTNHDSVFDTKPETPTTDGAPNSTPETPDGQA